MTWQMDTFKHIIYSDGNCAALRQRDLLSGDATVLAVMSAEDQWYSALLVPWRHYVPVRVPFYGWYITCLSSSLNLINIQVHYEPARWPDGTDLYEAWSWVNAHPDAAANIVRNAKAFSELHFTVLGQTCYVVRLLHEYSKLFTNLERLPELYTFERMSKHAPSA